MNKEFILLEPKAKYRTTGGYIFNNEITHALVKTGINIKRKTLAEIETLYSELNNSHKRVFIIDSLSFLFQPSSIINSLGSYFIILHSLNRPLWAFLKKENKKEHSKLEAVIVTSQFQKSLIQKSFPRITVYVIYPGLPDDLKPAAHSVQSTGHLSMLTVSNWTKEKGLGFMIKVLWKIRKLNWQWHLVGNTRIDSHTRRIFARYLAHRDFRKKIIIHGPLSQKAIKSIPSHLYLNPSWEESFGMAVYEAASRGIDVIGSGVGGIPEALKRAQTLHEEVSNNLSQENKIAFPEFHLINTRKQRPWIKQLSSYLERNGNPASSEQQTFTETSDMKKLERQFKTVLQNGFSWHRAARELIEIIGKKNELSD